MNNLIALIGDTTKQHWALVNDENKEIIAFADSEEGAENYKRRLQKLNKKLKISIKSIDK